MKVAKMYKKIKLMVVQKKRLFRAMVHFGPKNDDMVCCRCSKSALRIFFFFNFAQGKGPRNKKIKQMVCLKKFLFRAHGSFLAQKWHAPSSRDLLLRFFKNFAQGK